MEPSELREKFRRHSTASAVLSREETRESEKLVEISKSYLWSQATSMVKDCARQPIAYSYSSDSTPLWCSAVVTNNSVKGKLLRRVGRRRTDFLLQRGILLSRGSASAARVSHLVGDPIPMGAGKTALHEFEAAVAFFPMLRNIEHRDIAITHLSFDRAMYAPLLRLLTGRNSAFYLPENSAELLGAERKELELLDWIVGTPCACHDVHNSLVWGVAPYCDRQSLKEFHVVTVGLRNAFGNVMDHMEGFIDKHLAFTARTESDDHIAAFWSCVGIEAGWIDTFTDLNIWWDWELDCLTVDSRHRDNPSTVEDVTACLVYVYRSELFVDTRFLGVSRSCRMVLAILACGGRKLIDYTKADPEVHHSSTSGFYKLLDKHVRFAIVTAVSAFVPDSALHDLMEDDRVVLHYDSIVEGISSELDWLDVLPMQVWRRLASLEGPTVSAAEIRSQVMKSALLSVGYMRKRFLDPATTYPWRLAKGNIMENLEELSRTPGPFSDPTTRKIRRLLQKGFSSRHLAEGLSLLLDLSWSTLGVEQGHGSAAAIRRLHTQFTVTTIAARATLHQLRTLWNPPKVEGRLRAIDAGLSRLEAKKPSEDDGARHVREGSLCEGAAGSHRIGRGSRSRVVEAHPRGGASAVRVPPSETPSEI